MMTGGMNMKKVLILLIILSSTYVYSVDIDNMKKIYDKELIVYAEDQMDYSLFIVHMITALHDLEKTFEKRLEKVPTIYIYSNHISSSKKIFGSDTEVIQTAMADPVNLRIYLTSPYDNYKSKVYYYSVPIHEFVHLLYSPSDLWLREGMAVYFSKQLIKDTQETSIETYHDLYPEKLSNSNFLNYYNNCGWIVKYLFEYKLKKSVSELIEFSYSNNKASILGYGNGTMDDFIIEWRNWIKQYKLTTDST